MSNLYYTEPCAYLAKMLCEKSGMKKVFFANSGAEANEGAGPHVQQWMKPIFRFVVPTVIIFLYVYGLVTFKWH